MTLTQKKYFKISLGIATIIGCLLISYSITFESFTVHHYNASAKRIEQNLHKIQNNLESFAKGWLNQQTSNNKELNNLKQQIEKDKNVAVYCFAGDSMVYWTNNFPISENDLRKTDTTEEFVFTKGNVFNVDNITERQYVKNKYVSGQNSVIAIIPISEKFPYQNNYLQNGYNPTLEIPEQMFIDYAGNDNGWEIKGRNGETLFIAGIDINANTNVTSMHIRWVGIILLIFAILLFAAYFLFPQKPLWLLFFLIFAFSAFIWCVSNYTTFFTNKLFLFSPSTFVLSSFISSYGMLILYASCLFAVISVLFAKRHYIAKYLREAKTFIKYIVLVLFGLMAMAQSAIVCVITLSFLDNAANISLEFYKILDINFFSIISYIITAEMIVGFIFLQFLCLQTFRHKKQRIITVLCQAAIMSPIIANKTSTIIALFIIAFFFLTSLILVFNKSSRIKWKQFTAMVFLSTLFVVGLYMTEIPAKEKIVTREVLANKLSVSNDLPFEMNFSEISDKIGADTKISQYLESKKTKDEILQYLNNNYLRGYLSNYNCNLFICDNQTEIEVKAGDTDSISSENCIDYYDMETMINGNSTVSPNLWLMNYANGRINYTAKFTYKVNNKNILLVAEFSLMPNKQQRGYPELLTDTKGNQNQNIALRNYSYAKYYKGKLVSQFGNYKYDNELEFLTHKYFFSQNGYRHYITSIDDDNTIIISVMQISPLEYLSFNSFVFLFFLVVMFILMYISGAKVILFGSKINFRQKTIFMMLLLIMFLLIILTASVLKYNFDLFEDNKNEAIEDRMKLVNAEFYDQYKNQDYIGNQNEINNILATYSNRYFTDINVFGLDGNLISSSRPEIYGKKLTGTKINIEAVNELKNNLKPFFITQENIGKLNFNSVYFSLLNANGKPLAYINLPYFVQQQKYNEKLVSLTSAIINILIVIVMLGILFATLISNILAKPIETIRKQIGKINLSSSSEHIKYNGNDEVANLVKAYNNMLDRLDESAAKLAKTERESAWRKMARQIAHEIKNPLTPMKLSVQHVLRMKKDGDPRWQERFEALSQSLMEQIDILSATANEFSNFAKFANQEQEYQYLDAVAILREQVEIFKGYSNIKFTITVNGSEQKTVHVSKEQLQRVFTNLIKNAVQAIGEDTQGSISVCAEDTDKNFYRFSVTDSGEGVPQDQIEHLFQPNFTTKSSGSGLGLAMSKNIIENFGGTIIYKPTNNGEACFIVELPKKEKNENKS